MTPTPHDDADGDDEQILNLDHIDDPADRIFAQRAPLFDSEPDKHER